jgi:YidC/Oxa1 family membrane protein insertase
MFPLRHKSVVSMRKMQEIQPEIKAIQERYKKLKVTDPARQKMNAEMMNLYRERGVNPASGCVPMLLTLPVLISFYSMLSVAIELRGAPFIGWITDLSRHDPLFITPVLMGATQFVQTKMTPTTMDPTQQKVMLLMPLMFMAFFLWAPSGLVLYWTVANMWAIGQQALTNKIIGPMPQRTVRPPAERKLKNAGAGRSAQQGRQGAEVAMDLHERVRDFTKRTVEAMGLPLEVSVTETADGMRVDLSGEEGEALLRRQGRGARGAPADRQHRLSPRAGPDKSFVVDCMGYRRAKDAELKEMARFMMEKAKSTGAAAGDGSAESLRAAARAPHRGRGPGARVGEHRRRVSQDRHHLGEEVAGRRGRDPADVPARRHDRGDRDAPRAGRPRGGAPQRP